MTFLSIISFAVVANLALGCNNHDVSVSDAFHEQPNALNMAKALAQIQGINICDKKPPSYDCFMSGLSKTGYYFDSKTETCETFNYKCINDVFQTKEQCEESCSHRIKGNERFLAGESFEGDSDNEEFDNDEEGESEYIDNELETVKDVPVINRQALPICQRPMPHFDCLMAGPKKLGYYHNIKTGHCTAFRYMCVNDVFTSLEDCESQCKRFDGRIHQSIERKIPDLCSKPKEVGICRMAMHRYYFDSASGTCQKFIYGGCGGNANNFKSQAQCEKTCFP